jgi:hypothetical protein
MLREDMTIPVVKETYHTQCVVFVCNIWWYQIPKGERRHDNTSSKRNLSYTMYDRFPLLLVLLCRLTPLGIWYHHLLHMNATHCVWYVSFTTGIVISSLSFFYHTQCVVFVCNRWGYQIPKGERRHDNTSSKGNLITICCTRTLHIVYDRFLLLLVLSCRLSPLGIWYHHLLHTNTTCHVREQQMVIPNTKRRETTWQYQ